MDKQQTPTVQHRGLYPMTNHNGKENFKKECVYRCN